MEAMSQSQIIVEILITMRGIGVLRSMNRVGMEILGIIVGVEKNVPLWVGLILVGRVSVHHGKSTNGKEMVIATRTVTQW